MSDPVAFWVLCVGLALASIFFVLWFVLLGKIRALLKVILVQLQRLRVALAPYQWVEADVKPLGTHRKKKSEAFKLEQRGHLTVVDDDDDVGRVAKGVGHE